MKEVNANHLGVMEASVLDLKLIIIAVITLIVKRVLTVSTRRIGLINQSVLVI